MLEDYAHLAEGLLALYETTFDERWFAIARGLADRILERFADPAGGFFDTADDHERLITRPKDPQDNAVPSGGAMATTVLLRLAALTGEGRYREAAERALGTVAPYLARYPTGFAQWLVAASFAAARRGRGGDRRRPGRRRDPRAARAGLVDVAAVPGPGRGAAGAPPRRPRSPLLHDRVAIDGRPTAYVCRDFVCRCRSPTPDRLIDQLTADPAP